MFQDQLTELRSELEEAKATICQLRGESPEVASNHQQHRKLINPSSILFFVDCTKVLVVDLQRVRSKKNGKKIEVVRNNVRKITINCKEKTMWYTNIREKSSYEKNVHFAVLKVSTLVSHVPSQWRDRWRVARACRSGVELAAALGPAPSEPNQTSQQNKQVEDCRYSLYVYNIGLEQTYLLY